MGWEIVSATKKKSGIELGLEDIEEGRECRGLDASVLAQAVTILQENGSLPDSYKPHKLKGKYVGCWECHLQPDWLLIWRQNDFELELILVDTGTHSDLFKK